MPARDEQDRAKRLLLALYAVLCLAIVAVGFSSYRGYEQSIRTQVRDRMEAIAALKVTEVSAWRAERIGDGELLQRAPGFSELVGRTLSNPDDPTARAETGRWFEEIKKASDYTEVFLVDAAGTRVFSIPETTATLSPVFEESAAKAMASRSVTLVDFHRDGPASSDIHLSVVIPIASGFGTRTITGAVVLRIDPTAFLYPYIQQWPGGSASGETVLVERSGSDALILSELRADAVAALKTRIPLTKTDAPAVQAALGNEVSMDGVDHLGTKVVAATRRVPDSPWSVVARIEAAEVYAPLASRARTTVILGISIVLLGLLGLLVAARMQSLRLMREELATEAERAWLAAAIDQSLNEVYVFDAETLRFQYLNSVALENIGYSMDALLSMTALDLKPEHTADTFAALVEPLRTGDQSVLVFESVHRCKDGSEYPVEVHLQLTSRKDQRVFLALMNDISERRASEEALRAYQANLENLVTKRTTQLQGVNEELASMNEELTASNEELNAVNEELAALNEDFEASNEELQSLYREAAESGRELERLNRALSQSDNAKSDFLASMSHELRTPLNSVIGFSDIMIQGLAGELNAEQQRQMLMINSSGKHLLALINDVLDLSKIEAGRMESDVAPFDLCSVLSEVVESVRPQAEALGLALNTECLAPHLSVVSDARMVKQVLFNLLSNAIKFTDEGSVTVRLSLSGDTFLVDVSDTGPGIASADLQRIFDEFTQVRTGDRRPEGTGLGLAVSSRLAALLGGTLTVKSIVGEGSTFTLNLPQRSRMAEAD